MEVANKSSQNHLRSNQSEDPRPGSTESLIKTFTGIFGLDTKDLAKAVSHFRNPEEKAREIIATLERQGADPMEISRFERDMVDAMKNRFAPETKFGIAVQPFIDTITDFKTMKENALDGAAAVTQVLGGAGQVALSLELGATPMSGVLATHGLSNIAGGLGDWSDLVFPSENDVDLNVVRQGYERVAEMAGFDKSVGTTVHAMVGVVSAGSALLASREVVKNAGSALSYRAQVTAAETASLMELSGEAGQAVDTVFEAYRQQSRHEEK